MISSIIDSTSEFNFYIPIEYSNGFTKFFIAFLNSVAPVSVSKVFKLKGASEGNKGISDFGVLGKWNAD